MLFTDPSKGSCDDRLRAAAHLFIQRLFIRQATKAGLGQELSLIHAAGVRGGPEDVAQRAPLIQFQELVTSG